MTKKKTQGNKTTQHKVRKQAVKGKGKEKNNKIEETKLRTDQKSTETKVEVKRRASMSLPPSNTF